VHTAIIQIKREYFQNVEGSFMHDLFQSTVTPTLRAAQDHYSDFCEHTLILPLLKKIIQTLERPERVTEGGEYDQSTIYSCVEVSR
jgi:hypothetical protein